MSLFQSGLDKFKNSKHPHRQEMKVLYQDKHVTITDFCVTINKYYFPLATSKTILFTEMSKISILDARSVNHRWGPAAKFLNNWFHLDGERKNKARFIEIQVKGSNVRPSFTPEDVDKAFNALRTHFMEMQRKSVQFQSNRGKETELDQKQAHQMMEQEMEVNEMKEETNSEIKKKESITVENIE